MTEDVLRRVVLGNLHQPRYSRAWMEEMNSIMKEVYRTQVKRMIEDMRKPSPFLRLLEER